jgi:hypothetical protein
MTQDDLGRIRGWFSGRLPEEWQAEPPDVAVDREEITVVLHLADVAAAQGDQPGETPSDAEVAEARAGRASAFREHTRARRMAVAREAVHRFGRKVSWGVTVGDHRELYTNVAAPVMTRLRQPQRQVLDTLVDAGVARSRADALAWCVRLVGQHEEEWLAELREAMTRVAEVRERGPAG